MIYCFYDFIMIHLLSIPGVAVVVLDEYGGDGDGVCGLWSFAVNKVVRLKLGNITFIDYHDL